MTMRWSAVAGLCLLTAAGAAAQPGSRVRIAVAGHNAPVLVDSLASFYDIAAPRDSTFDAVTRALAQLGATLDARDAARGIVGMTNFPRMRTFSGKPLSRLVNCGSGFNGPNADNWRVYLSVYAFVDAVDASHTRLRVAVVGGARDVAGTSTAPVACASTGAFEEMVVERVRRLLAAGAPGA